MLFLARVNFLNKKQLATSLGRSRTYVSAMCRAGFVFQYGGLTTLEEALDWLRANPDFRVSSVYGN